jgi:O-antigen/teichoic acid export membrane protein
VSSTTTARAGGTQSPAPAGGDGGPGGRDEVTPPQQSFASGARILTIGIASTGIFTFLYLAIASNVLDPSEYSRISLCWAVMFVILSVIYRPIEQLLSRTIADRRARGLHGHPLRVPAAIQFGFAVLFLIVALVLRDQIQQGMFDGSAILYWILVVGVMAYAGSYFARGWLAGHQRFALYGGLVFLESTSRFLFPLAVAVGIGTGQGAVGLGMAVAPFASLSVMPLAFRKIRGNVQAAEPTGSPGGPGPTHRAAADPVAADGPGADTVLAADAAAAGEGPAQTQLDESSTELTMRHGAGFAVSVLGIMFSEQMLMNAGVLIVAAKAGGGDLTTGVVGFVFNVMLIVRAPLQLFQAIQTSILPHLAGLEARESADEFHRAIRTTILVIAGFGVAVALGLLAVGPPVMTAVLGSKGFVYGRLGLAAVGLGMGLHLVSGTLNQAALARGRASAAALAWLVAAGAFVAFVATGGGVGHAEVTRVEVGYLGATALLTVLLWLLYRRGPARSSSAAASRLAPSAS